MVLLYRLHLSLQPISLAPCCLAGQRVMRLQVWMEHYRKLCELKEMPMAPAAKRARTVDLVRWSYESRAVRLDAQTLLPSQPVKWKLLQPRAIGADAASAVRGCHLLARLAATGLRLSALQFEPVLKKVLVPALAAPAAYLPSYVRVSMDEAAARAAIVRTLLGVDDLHRLAPLSVGPGLRPPLLNTAGAPKSTEALGQVWLHPHSTTRCTPHYDLPDSVLVVLGGVKRVALLHPDAPKVLGLSISARGLKLNASILDDHRFEHEWLGVRPVVDLQPGEAVYIPSGWWHEVESVAGTVGLSLPVERSVGERSAGSGGGSGHA